MLFPAVQLGLYRSSIQRDETFRISISEGGFWCPSARESSWLGGFVRVGADGDFRSG
jgi:hypothetical protein